MDTLLRIAWFLGAKHGCESYREAKERAIAAADFLIKEARENGSVCLVGHGVFNRLIAKELEKRQWQGTIHHTHWSCSTYILPKGAQVKVKYSLFILMIVSLFGCTKEPTFEEFKEEMLAEQSSYLTHVVAYEEAKEDNQAEEMLKELEILYEEATKLASLYNQYPPPENLSESMLSVFEGASADLSTAFSLKAEVHQLEKEALESGLDQQDDINRLKTEANEFEQSGLKKLDRIASS